MISNTRQVDKSAGEGCGRGRGSQCWCCAKKSRAHLRLDLRPGPPSSHSIQLPNSNASSLIQVQCGIMQFFSLETNTQTTQAIVIVLLNDMSLKRLWKRANPLILRLGTELEVCPCFCWYVGSLLGPCPQSLLCRRDLLYISWHDLQVGGPKTNLLDTASPDLAQRTSLDRVRRRQLAEKHRHLSLGVHSWNVFFFVFAKTLMIKKKILFLVFKEMYPMWPINSVQTHTGTTTPPLPAAWFSNKFPVTLLVKDQHHSSLLHFYSSSLIQLELVVYAPAARKETMLNRN